MLLGGDLVPAEAPVDPDGVEAEAGDLLVGWWNTQFEWADEFGEGSVLATQLAPFGREFPPLASAESTCAYDALALHPDRFTVPRKIALVAVDRPADVPAVIGWNGTNGGAEGPGEITVVLRSWEDRFGVYLTELAFDAMWLNVERPPTREEDSLRWQAELMAFNFEFVYDSTLESLALPVPVVGELAFWWD